MKLEKLTIGLKYGFRDPGPDNPYEATLSVSYNDNSMKVRLSDEACRHILELAGDEIAAAAQVQISDFVRTALSVSKTPMIEGGGHPMNRKDEPRFLNLRNGGNMKDDRDTAYVTPVFLVLIALGGLGIYLNLGL